MTGFAFERRGIIYEPTQVGFASGLDRGFTRRFFPVTALNLPAGLKRGNNFLNVQLPVADCFWPLRADC